MGLKRDVGTVAPVCVRLGHPPYTYTDSREWPRLTRTEPLLLQLLCGKVRSAARSMCRFGWKDGKVLLSLGAQTERSATYHNGSYLHLNNIVPRRARLPSSPSEPWSFTGSDCP
jgi:hypothetical protein